MVVKIIEVEQRDSPLGEVLYIKMYAEGYPQLSWKECWKVFAEKYPGQWAVQMFPPVEQLVNGKCVYHLFVLENEPEGLNIR